LQLEYGRSLLKPPGETFTIVFDATGISHHNVDYMYYKFLVDTVLVCMRDGDERGARGEEGQY
jgi:hypothetical protein